MKTLQIVRAFTSSSLTRRTFLPGLLGVLIALSGCAFDIVSVPQKPTAFSKVETAAAKNLCIDVPLEIRIGTGFVTRIKAGTTWSQLGSLPEGDVFQSRDQILVVEASHIHEAALVIKDRMIVGFFLLVEKTFCPAKNPTLIPEKTS